MFNYDYDYSDVMEDAAYYARKRDPEYKKITEKLEHAQDHMIGLYDELAGDKEIDLRAVYWYLEEICSALDIDDSKFAPVNIKRDHNPIHE